MPQAACPSYAELAAFTRGELPGAALESIGYHMERCPACDRAAEALESAPEPVADALRREAEETERIGAFAAKTSQPPNLRPAAVRWLGGYEVLEELGRGGMGVVYKGWDADLKRHVALKVIRSGEHAGAAEAVRFRREAEAVARVHHSGLVQIYDIGHDNGLPFLALEYVAGGTLERHLDRGPLSPAAAARLSVALADAVQAAHDNGVIHRDLKPGNVLLAHPPTNGAWAVKVADFGLAKYLDSSPALSDTGQVAGTPSYMAPEQAAGRGHEVGPATDVYALGVILYEALVGHPPFQGESSADTLAQVLRVEPVAPSRLRPRVPLDLETICLKCLVKDPRRRYPSARELADDLNRFLTDRPIRARRAGPIEKLARVCRRNPLPAALVALVVVSLVGGTAAASHFALLAGRRETEARANEADAMRGKKEADAARDELRQNLYFAQMHLAGHAVDLHRPWPQVAALIDPWRTIAANPVRPGWEWRYLDAVGHRDIARLPHDKPIQALVWNPAGTRVALLDKQGGGEIRSLPPAAQQRIDLAPDSVAVCAAWSPDGRRLATGGLMGGVRIWRAEDGALLHALPTPGGVLTVSWNRDGQRLAALGPGAVAMSVWKADTGAALPSIPLPPNRGHRFALSADWSRLAAVSAGRIDLFDLVGGRPPVALDGSTMALEWSPDGRRLAVERAAYRVAVIDAATGRTTAVLHGHRAPVTALDWSPDGTTLVTVSNDAVVYLWDAAEGTLSHTLLGHSGPLLAVGWSRTGGRILSAGVDGEARVWPAQPPAVKLASAAVSLSWSRDASRLSVIDNGGRLHVVGRDGMRELSPSAGYPVNAAVAVWSPQADVIACGGKDGVVRLLDPATGATLSTLGGRSDAVTALAWDRTGNRLAVARKGAVINVWDVKAGRIVRAHIDVGRNVRAVAWGADGSLAAAVGSEAWVWSDQGEKTVFAPPAPANQSEQVTHLAWSPEGKDLAVGGWLGRVFILPRGSREPRQILPAGEGTEIGGLAWSPDGRRLAAAAFGNGVQLWDAATGASAFAFEAAGGLSDLAWSPDGTALAGVTRGEGRVMAWDAAASPSFSRPARPSAGPAPSP